VVVVSFSTQDSADGTGKVGEHIGGFLEDVPSCVELR